MSKLRKKHLLALSLSALSLLLALGYFLASSFRVPAYDGRTVTEWIMLANYGEVGGGLIGINRLRSVDAEEILPILVTSLQVEELPEPLMHKFHRSMHERAGSRWPGWLPPPSLWNTNVIQFQNNTSQAIKSFGAEIEIVRPELTRLLLHSQRNVRDNAAYCLKQLDTDLASSLPTIIQALEEQKVSYMLFRLLTRIGPQAKGAVPALKRLAQVDEVRYRSQIAKTLVKLDPSESEFAYRVLEPILTGTNRAVQIGVVEALWSIHHDPDEVMPYLVSLLEVDNMFSHRAMRLIVRMGPEGSKTLPLVVRYLQSAQAIDRLDAVRILWAVNRNPDEVLNIAIQLLSEQGQERDAARLLGDLGSTAERAVPHLNAIVSNSKDAEAVLAVSNAIASIRSDRSTPLRK